MADAITSSSIISSSFCGTSNLCRPAALPSNQGRFQRRAASASGLSPFSVRTHQRSDTFKVHAALSETDQPKWWEKKSSSNMIDIHSKEELLNAFKLAGDRLVIVEFYGTWCGSCRALHPKLCKTAQGHGDILFLKVNFDENKIMCKNLNIRVLPYFHFYRGADGQLEAFSCSLSNFQRIKEAIDRHNSARCSLDASRGDGDLILENSSQL